MNDNSPKFRNELNSIRIFAITILLSMAVISSIAKKGKITTLSKVKHIVPLVLSIYVDINIIIDLIFGYVNGCCLHQLLFDTFVWLCLFGLIITLLNKILKNEPMSKTYKNYKTYKAWNWFMTFLVLFSSIFGMVLFGIDDDLNIECKIIKIIPLFCITALLVTELLLKYGLLKISLSKISLGNHVEKNNVE